MRIFRVVQDEQLDRAIFQLCEGDPRKSAITVITFSQFCFIAALCLLIIYGFVTAPNSAMNISHFAITLFIAMNVSLHALLMLVGLIAGITEPVERDDVAALRDEDLPVYTILAPVYREAKIVSALIRNLEALNYPPSKLEILLLLEDDDPETLEVALKACPPDNFSLVIIPNSQPKTKPKACNIGLFLAKGEYLVIYDAEDQPDRDQLKKAVVAFRRSSANLIGVQAMLNYSNVSDNFLTRMCSLEYLRWSGCMWAGLDRLGMPIPLGGTSNHFRTDTLRALGGWDPFNVTEDLDLGIRAASLGYRVKVINSITYEEANGNLKNWIRQRSRWIKGYMQTSLVYLRNPDVLIKRMGLLKSIGIGIFLLGPVLSYFVAPLSLMIWLIAALFSVQLLVAPILLQISFFNFLTWSLVIFYLNLRIVIRRKHYSLLPNTLLEYAYWPLYSLAAYKAFWQLCTRPFFWEKTLHGFSSEADQKN